ncbi:biopolymer transporter ExbD [Parasphingopyxis sp.]|uniref:ExbD/TolR family protein n=1 Tax=Parasphingopyxis sp. TaxID=1920299 RepID=UPI00260BCD24|nr:biopolymer transporter ExbD [Parasphingopyxis sp.]
MKLDRERPKRELINITPLIDVVFILLVFFMLAGSIEPEDAFPVSPAASVSDIRGDIQDVVILVDEDGRVALGDRAIPTGGLEAAVRKILTNQPDALIQVKPDADADAVALIDIMEDVRSAGAEYIVLLTVGQPEVSGV